MYIVVHLKFSRPDNHEVLEFLLSYISAKAIPPALAASGTRRGFHGPRPPPFAQLPRFVSQQHKQQGNGARDI